MTVDEVGTLFSTLKSEWGKVPGAEKAGADLAIANVSDETFPAPPSLTSQRSFPAGLNCSLFLTVI